MTSLKIIALSRNKTTSLAKIRFYNLPSKQTSLVFFKKKLRVQRQKLSRLKIINQRQELQPLNPQRTRSRLGRDAHL